MRKAIFPTFKMDLAKPSPGVGLLLFAALKLELVSQVGIHPQTTSKERQAGGTEMSSKPSIPRLRSLPVCSSSQDARAWASGRCFKLKATIRNHASPIPFCPSHFQSFIQVLTFHLTKSKQHSFFEEPTEWTQAVGMSTWHDNSFETLICVLFFLSLVGQAFLCVPLTEVSLCSRYLFLKAWSY